ncbi:MAG: ROK family protein [Deltaproteobacteria bacterium]|nr:ROK family protein [Deltaproteobacteria bacterium]
MKEKSLVLGVDLGATKLKTALVDDEGRVVFSHRHPTHPGKDPEVIIAEIVTRVQDCLTKTSKGASALGIGVAGQVDRATGIVRFAPNLGWQDVPLRVELEKRLGLPVVVTNDVRAATWGEWLYGIGKGMDNLVCLFVGTGIGGGVVSGGQMLEGYSNTAGELGHMTIVVGGRPCRCPNRGCLEAYAGGWAISERAQELVREDPILDQTLVHLAGSIEAITASTIAQAYEEGCPLASRLVRETGEYLGAGVVSCVNAFNPEMVILGGGVIERIPVVISIVEEVVRGCALKAATGSLRIVKGILGEDAGVIGAAGLARKSKELGTS